MRYAIGLLIVLGIGAIGVVIGMHIEHQNTVMIVQKYQAVLINSARLIDPLEKVNPGIVYTKP